MTKATTYRLSMAIVAALLALVFALPAAYAEGGNGTISGQVQNKTQGGGPVSGLDVTLHSYAHQTTGDTATTKTDGNGAFRFDNLITANNYAYVLSVGFKNVTFASDFVVFEADKTTLDADIQVYEPVDRPDKVSIQRAHIVFGAPTEEQTLPVMEILILNNNDDHVFVPSDPAKGSVQINIPSGARNLEREPELDASSVDTPGGFAYLEPLLPGASQFLFSYELPYTSGSYSLSHAYAYPVGQVSLLVPDSGITVSSPEMTGQPSQNLGGDNYLVLQASNLQPGKDLNVRFGNLPVPSFFSKLPEAVRWGVPAVIGLAFVGAIAFVLLRRRSRDDGDEEYDEASEDEYDDEDYADEDYVDEDDDLADREEEPVTKR